ncbi:hypothetical protein D9757_002192 [Collybiopsis confluens]|uniref:P-loop containing nucleoside triphosphate hydrolase protein n=1 Tax=Collybiopsis confluens TaxID=2823264 RepID=A0A8H5I008_9AGAR|nr:hypothetical protein D9757_002192 [Collybiopsis confluens]
MHSFGLHQFKSLTISAYAVWLSIALFAIQAALRLPIGRGHTKHVRSKTVVIMFNGLRAIGCVTLACISFLLDWYSGIISIWDSASLAFLYTALLSLYCVYSSSKSTATYHLNSILLLILAVYAYRDVGPLCTYSGVIQDASEGRLLWAKIVILLIVAAIIPLLIPRMYGSDIDSEGLLNAEATSSWASLLSYSFLDRFIWMAYRSSQISEAQLSPLADYDNVQTLKARYFPILDPLLGAPRRHIFFSLLRIFSSEYTVLLILSLLNTAAEFASPVGINRLLNYIETGGRNALVKPWFWILCLFLGPTVQSLTKESYEFVANRTQVQAEALLTELLFEHSLRIRPPATSTGDTETTAGRLNNLVTTDLANVMAAKDFFQLFIQIPLQIVLCVIFLYLVLGWSAFVGLAIILLSIPIPGLVGKQLHGVQTNLVQKTDSRVSEVVEALNLIRMIKLFGWQQKTGTKINQSREEELKWVWKRDLVGFSNRIINFLLPILTLIGTYCTYVRTLIMKQELSASKMFSTMSVITTFRTQLYLISATITAAIAGKVSLDRINEFLLNAKLLDRYSDSAAVNRFSPHLDKIGFRNATFSWSDETEVSNREFLLQIESELVFNRGTFNVIVGPTGAGKTSVLMALLGELGMKDFWNIDAHRTGFEGEMHFLPRGHDAWFNLPRKEGVAYAAQNSWLLNRTIKDNIVFGNRFNPERYREVIHQCGLEHDIELLEDGDLTEVGEQGVTLSGGQKARITLARAVYSPAEILLLDDVLSALDVHTAKWIVSKCFKGHLMKDRTVLLVTHNVAFLSGVTDFVVSIGPAGFVEGVESVKKAMTNDTLFRNLKDEENTGKNAEEIADTAADSDNTASARNLVLKEEKEEGHVNWGGIKMYFDGLAGHHRFLFHSCFLLTMVLSNASIVAQTGYLSHWASQYDHISASQVPVSYYIGIFSLIVFSSIFWHIICQIVFIRGSLRASKSIHRQLMEAILGATFRWLDQTPTSRVIVRATQDISVVDGPLREELFSLWNLVSYLLIQFAVVVVISPVFFFPGVLLFALGLGLSYIYMRAQLSVKREMAAVRAPVLAHFSASVTGLISIRAYGAQNAFIEQSLDRINAYSRAARTFYNLTRWITLRLDLLGASFASALATYLVYVQQLNAATSGLSLNMGVGLSTLTLYLVQILNQVEIQSNSVERIRQYIKIDQEPKPQKLANLPAYWPASGSLRVQNLSARYSSDEPEILHDLSFDVKSGERIGVAGRTGSGKSSLTLSLLRAIQTSGEVFFDGVPTSQLPVETLRSNITFIPQTPELLSGSLRYNLDPFDRFEDSRLNDAIRAAGLYSLERERHGHRLTLDTTIASGGSNLSVGERQILALARAILQGSKLLILDEATSAIDHKTDEVIQDSLRNELGKDVTLIAVAHRLRTIMDADRIMVLENGRIVEFDSPIALLNKESLFREMVEHSEDKELLYRIARK